ncbi:MAG: hypothetical protein M0Z48_01400 [Nitrospiraceae bacterium]|nr:hypothetical protein [Nitrospiraceae bacterium]
MKIDVNEYRQKYLKEVEERITAKKDSIQHFTTQNLHDAVMTELNRADDETWLVEIPDDKEQAVKEAEARMIHSIEQNVDLGVGKSW